MHLFLLVLNFADQAILVTFAVLNFAFFILSPYLNNEEVVKRPVFAVLIFADLKNASTVYTTTKKDDTLRLYETR